VIGHGTWVQGSTQAGLIIHYQPNKLFSPPRFKNILPFLQKMSPITIEPITENSDFPIPIGTFPYNPSLASLLCRQDEPIHSAGGSYRLHQMANGATAVSRDFLQTFFLWKVSEIII